MANFHRNALQHVRPSDLADCHQTAPLMRFFFPTALSSMKIHLSILHRRKDTQNRHWAYLTHCLSAFKVSHLRDGFLFSLVVDLFHSTSTRGILPFRAFPFHTAPPHCLWRVALLSFSFSKSLRKTYAFRAFIHGKVRWYRATFPRHQCTPMLSWLLTSSGNSHSSLGPTFVVDPLLFRDEFRYEPLRTQRIHLASQTLLL